MTPRLRIVAVLAIAAAVVRHAKKSRVTGNPARPVRGEVHRDKIHLCRSGQTRPGCLRCTGRSYKDDREQTSLKS